MIRSISVVALVTMACTGLAAGFQSKPTYVKFSEAQKIAAATGRPIAVYSVTNAEGGGC